MAVVRSWVRGGVVIAMVIGGAGLGSRVSWASVVSAPEVSAASFAELTAQAEEYRAAGEHRKAAFSFAAAYAALGERDQGGLKGEITVSNAVDDYRLAQEKDPESLVLLEEEAALLERFGTHPKRKDAMPAALAEELARVRSRVEALWRAEEAAAEAEEQRLADEAAKEEERRQAEEAAMAEEQGRHTNADDSRARRKADLALVGVGVVSVVGGFALIANGAWNLGNVQRRGDELLATLEANAGGTAEERDGLRDEIEGWQDRWRGIGTGLAVSGVVLTAAGIGLTTWGILRMRQGKGREGQVSVVRPMISGRGVGLVVGGRF